CADVLHGVLKQDGPVEDIESAAQIAGSTLRVSIAGSKLVAGKHLDDQPVVALVLVERLDNPIAPAPDMPAAVAQLVEAAAAVPIAVPPNIHPVPAPALAVARAGQKLVHEPLVGLEGLVGEKGVQLVARRRQADKVKVDPAEQDFVVGGRLLSESAVLVLGGNEGI